MMNAMREPMDDPALSALFAEAREADPPPLPPEFQARLVADALAAVPRRPGLLARLRAALNDLGGAPGLAGVAAAGVAGLWIGVAAPGSTGDLVAQVWQGVAPQTTWSGSEAAFLQSADGDLLALLGTNED